MEKLWKYNITSYHLFIDFRTAYDSIDRSKMWKALAELRISDELVQMCKLESSKTRIRIHGGVSDTLRIEKGIK